MQATESLEWQSNLEALLLHDLAMFGITISKKSRKRDAQCADHTLTTSLLFGSELHNLATIDIEGHGAIPKFLVDCVSLLETSLDCEGLFRKSGSITRVKDLQAHIEAGGMIDGANPLDVASLMKQFIRQLPEPLLTSRLQDSFLQCQALHSAERVNAILELCLLLPPCHLSTLKYITCFLQRVAGCQVFNKMSASNLAVCLAPNIFRVGRLGDLADVKYFQAQTAVLHLLIEQSCHIGEVSAELRHRLSLMTSCLSAGEEESNKDGDNDEKNSDSDGSDEEYGGGGRVVEKKRSGSFQGLVSNLSSSFTRWRNKEKTANSVGPSCCNSSSSILNGSSNHPIASGASVGSDLTGTTPLVMRKRKAADGALPFSAGKKKAIIQNMPQMSVLGGGGASYTPNGGRSCGKGQIVKANCMTVEDDYSQTPLSSVGWNEEPANQIENHLPYKMKRSESPSSLTSGQINSSTTSSSTSKSKVRRSFQGLLRRLSGSKDSSRKSTELSSDDIDTLPSMNHLGQQSPRALTFNFNPSPPPAHPFPTDVQQSDNTATRRGPGHQRSQSVEPNPGLSLRRGRPNTMWAGLPSPVNRRASDADRSAVWPLICNDQSAVVQRVERSIVSVVDTSPIACLVEGEVAPFKIATVNDNNESSLNPRRILAVSFHSPDTVLSSGIVQSSVGEGMKCSDDEEVKLEIKSLDCCDSNQLEEDEDMCAGDFDQAFIDGELFSAVESDEVVATSERLTDRAVAKVCWLNNAKHGMDSGPIADAIFNISKYGEPESNFNASLAQEIHAASVCELEVSVLSNKEAVDIGDTIDLAKTGGAKVVVISDDCSASVTKTNFDTQFVALPTGTLDDNTFGTTSSENEDTSCDQKKPIETVTGTTGVMTVGHRTRLLIDMTNERFLLPKTVADELQQCDVERVLGGDVTPKIKPPLLAAMAGGNSMLITKRMLAKTGSYANSVNGGSASVFGVNSPASRKLDSPLKVTSYLSKDMEESLR